MVHILLHIVVSMKSIYMYVDAAFGGSDDACGPDAGRVAPSNVLQLG